jgi:hypothetical protein
MCNRQADNEKLEIHARYLIGAARRFMLAASRVTPWSSRRSYTSSRHQGQSCGCMDRAAKARTEHRRAIRPESAAA